MGFRNDDMGDEGNYSCRAELIGELRAQVRAGQYRPAAEDVADAILRRRSEWAAVEEYLGRHRAEVDAGEALDVYEALASPEQFRHFLSERLAVSAGRAA